MIPGLFLLSITLLAFDKYLVVAVITLSLGFNGAATMTNLQNSQDLAPNFAGTLYGIINFVGTTSGFISPIIVAYFTEDGVSKFNGSFINHVLLLDPLSPTPFYCCYGLMQRG